MYDPINSNFSDPISPLYNQEEAVEETLVEERISELKKIIFDNTKKIIESKLADRQNKIRQIGEKTYLRLGDGPRGVFGSLKKPEPYFDPHSGRFMVALLMKGGGGVLNPEIAMDKEAETLAKLEEGLFVPMYAYGYLTNPRYPQEEETLAMMMGKMHEDLFDVKERIVNGKNPFILAKGIGEDLKSLHEKGWLHKDLKPDNALVSWDNEERTELKEAKVIDFDRLQKGLTGFSDDETGFLKQLSEVQTQTFEYITPDEFELENVSPYNEKVFKQKFCQLYGLDPDLPLTEQKEHVIHALQLREMFTLGMVLYEALSGGARPLYSVRPYKDKDLNYGEAKWFDSNRARQDIADGLAQSSLSTRQQEAFTNLVMQCLDKDPLERPIADDFYADILRIERL